MQNVAEMTSAEMIAEYNALTGKSIKKFSTRAAGEKQLIKARLEVAADKVGLDLEEVAEESPVVAQLMEVEEATEEVAAEEVAAEEVAPQPDAFEVPEEVWENARKYDYKVDGCPGCGAKQDITAAGLEFTAAGDRLFCHNCSTEFREDGRIYKGRKSNTTSISEGVKATWAKPEVAASRAKRDAVEVEGPGIKGEGPAQFKSVAAAFKALNLHMSGHIKFRMELKAKGAATYGAYSFKIVSK